MILEKNGHGPIILEPSVICSYPYKICQAIFSNLGEHLEHKSTQLEPEPGRTRVKFEYCPRTLSRQSFWNQHIRNSKRA